MGHVIAISGKGGVGKTTLCGLLIQYLCESGKCPVLAVDADANANLNEVLGVEPVMTLCFMSLAVIPEIKLTDMGLFDVTTFSFIPVEAE